VSASIPRRPNPGARNASAFYLTPSILKKKKFPPSPHEISHVARVYARLSAHMRFGAAYPVSERFFALTFSRGFMETVELTSG
jgi:hypothetical protein